jgi:hypothetical protein
VGQLNQGLNVRDTGCGQASMWIFDGTLLSGNEICFLGEGQANLAYYSRTICSKTTCWMLNWGGATKSYFSGTESGYFKYQPDPVGAYYPEYYPAFHLVDFAGPNAQRAGLLVNTN